MGKEKRSVSVTLNTFVREYGKVFSTDGQILFCLMCNSNVTATKKFQVDQHLKTAKHLKNAELKKPTQTLLTQNLGATSKVSEFNKDLCEASVSANIPGHKLKNFKFREFLEEYTKTVIPDESTLRKTYIPRLFETTIKEIRNQLHNMDIWVSLDETTDSLGRYVANFVVGDMQEKIFFF